MKRGNVLVVPRNSLWFQLVRFLTSGGYGEQYIPKTRLGLWFTYLGAIVIGGTLFGLFGLVAIFTYRDEGVYGILRLFSIILGLPLTIVFAALNRSYWLPRLQRRLQPVKEFLLKPIEYR